MHSYVKDNIFLLVPAFALATQVVSLIILDLSLYGELMLTINTSVVLGAIFSAGIPLYIINNENPCNVKNFLYIFLIIIFLAFYFKDSNSGVSLALILSAVYFFTRIEWAISHTQPSKMRREFYYYAPQIFKIVVMIIVMATSSLLNEFTFYTLLAILMIIYFFNFDTKTKYVGYSSLYNYHFTMLLSLGAPVLTVSIYGWITSNFIGVSYISNLLIVYTVCMVFFSQHSIVNHSKKIISSHSIVEDFKQIFKKNIITVVVATLALVSSIEMSFLYEVNIFPDHYMELIPLIFFGLIIRSFSSVFGIAFNRAELVHLKKYYQLCSIFIGVIFSVLGAIFNNLFLFFLGILLAEMLLFFLYFRGLNDKGIF